MRAYRGSLRAPARPLPVVVAGVLTLVLAIVVGAFAQGRLLLHGCLPADAFGTLGVRLALLRDAAECPAGTYGLGAAPRGAVVLLSVALPVLALHLVLAACGLGLLTVVRRALRGIAGVLGAVAHRLPAGSPARVAPTTRRLLPAPVVRHLRARAGMLTWSHRGPPALV